MPVGSKWSAQDDELASSSAWYIAGAGYVMNSSGAYFHRIVMGCPRHTVDHINGDRLDNRRENLRVLSKAQNCANRTVLHSRNSSGFNGVSLCKVTGRWKAYIKRNYRQIHLGRFDSREEAAQAVAEWLILHPVREESNETRRT